jgi:hypothetical protein
MMDRRDPEWPARRDEEKARMDAAWRRGVIGDSTYLRSLMLLGWDDRDVHVELNLLRMEKR